MVIICPPRYPRHSPFCCESRGNRSHGIVKVVDATLFGKTVDIVMRVDYRLLSESPTICSKVIEMKNASLNATFIPQMAAEMR